MKAIIKWIFIYVGFYFAIQVILVFFYFIYESINLSHSEYRETSEVENTKISEIDLEESLWQETRENQEEAPESPEGWQYQGEKQAYLWGTWSVTMGKEHWGTLEILPDSWSFKSENPDYPEDYLIEQFELYASPFLTKYRSLDSMFDLKENYCLEITPITPEGHDLPAPCTQLFLVNQDFMVGFTGRTPVVLERKEAYAGELENGSFVPTDYGFWRGDWEIRKAIKADGEDVEQYIGMQFHTDGKGTDREEITGIYILTS